MMIGGDREQFERLLPLFRTLAPAEDRGYVHTGPSGSGHFVKMVHNGIEYGLMQAYAEGFELMRAKSELDLDLAEIAETWRWGSVVRSWLLDLTADALRENPALEGIRGVRRGLGRGALDGGGVDRARGAGPGHHNGAAGALPVPAGPAVRRATARGDEEPVRRPRGQDRGLDGRRRRMNRDGHGAEPRRLYRPHRHSSHETTLVETRRLRIWEPHPWVPAPVFTRAGSAGERRVCKGLSNGVVSRWPAGRWRRRRQGRRGGQADVNARNPDPPPRRYNPPHGRPQLPS